MSEFEYFSATAAKLLKLADAARIAETLAAGGLAVLPTETGYMIAADATNLSAVRKVFEAKERDLGNPMHVACPSLRMARAFANLTPIAARLLGEFTPGPLTVVVDQSGRLPDSLVTLNGTVGIRIPDHPATLQVIDLLGAPVTATSLNRSGQESAPLDRTEMRSLRWPAGQVVPVLEDKTSITESQASTLVRLTGDVVEVLRKGPISEETVLRVALI